MRVVMHTESENPANFLSNSRANKKNMFMPSGLRGALECCFPRKLEDCGTGRESLSEAACTFDARS